MPRVLLIAVDVVDAPTASPYRDGGFDVGVLARAERPAAGAGEPHFAFRSVHRFRPMFADLHRAVARFQPDLIVPLGDRVSWFIRESAARAEGRLRETLVRSFGRLETMDDRLFKHRTMALGRSLELDIPRSLLLASHADLENAGREIGFPLVCKRSHGASGKGVRICADPVALALAYAELTRGGSRLRHLRRRLSGTDWWPSQSVIRAEAHIDGEPAMSTAAALDGRPLAILTAVATRTTGPTGPAREVRLMRHDGMAAITTAMIEAFGASGLISFDFMLDRTGRAVLIECNARPIRLTSRGGPAGLDLIGTLRAGIEGHVPAAPRVNGEGEWTVRWDR